MWFGTGSGAIFLACGIFLYVGVALNISEEGFRSGDIFALAIVTVLFILPAILLFRSAQRQKIKSKEEDEKNKHEQLDMGNSGAIPLPAGATAIFPIDLGISGGMRDRGFGEIVLYPDRFYIWRHWWGLTYWLSLLFLGPIGSYLFGPFFGSLTAYRNCEQSRRWEEVEEVAIEQGTLLSALFSPLRRAAKKRKRISFISTEPALLIREVQTFVPVNRVSASLNPTSAGPCTIVFYLQG